MAIKPHTKKIQLKNDAKPRLPNFGVGVKKLGKPDLVRYLKEMKDVLYDKKWFKSAKNFPVYYVWRGVKEENEIRYDITIIPPRRLGQEFPKTKGHRHLKGFQELIKVLEGKAFYFAQKGRGQFIKDCYVIEAKKGDLVIIPPGYDHLTINPSNKKLIMANWLSKKCQSDYSLFEKFQGACYYYTKSGWIKNENYAKIPSLRFEKPLKSIPRNLDFLKKCSK